MKKDNKGPIVREIPISREELPDNPMEILANPPLFPLLKGEESRMIVDQITKLTKEGKIQWEQDYSYRVTVTYAEYLGLIIFINRKNCGDWTDPSGLTFNRYVFYGRDQGHLATISADEKSGEAFKELIVAVRESLARNRANCNNPLGTIWKILNLRWPL